VLDGGTAGHKEDGEVVGEDDTAERRRDLGEADLLPGEEVEEREPRGVVVGGRDEVAVRVEEGAAGEGQVVTPGRGGGSGGGGGARGGRAPLRRRGRARPRGAGTGKRVPRGTAGGGRGRPGRPAGGAQREEVLEGGQAGGDVWDERRAEGKASAWVRGWGRTWERCRAWRPAVGVDAGASLSLRLWAIAKKPPLAKGRRQCEQSSKARLNQHQSNN
jgi:hypothetical protein